MFDVAHCKCQGGPLAYVLWVTPPPNDLLFWLHGHAVLSWCMKSSIVAVVGVVVVVVLHVLCIVQWQGGKPIPVPFFPRAIDGSSLVGQRGPTKSMCSSISLYVEVCACDLRCCMLQASPPHVNATFDVARCSVRATYG